MCLGGVAIDALENTLATNSQLKEVYLCLDNDKVGNMTVERIGKELDEHGVWWKRIVPQTKDWNQDLTEGWTLEENFNLSL